MFVKVVNLFKIYYIGKNEIRVLDDVSFEFEKGKIYIVIGFFGFGKIILFNILGGFDRVDKGKVFVDGREIINFDLKRLFDYRKDYVGFVF